MVVRAATEVYNQREDEKSHHCDDLDGSEDKFHFPENLHGHNVEPRQEGNDDADPGSGLDGRSDVILLLKAISRYFSLTETVSFQYWMTTAAAEMSVHTAKAPEYQF